MSDAPKDSEPRKVPKTNMYVVGTVVALVISIPAIVAFLVAWRFMDNMFNALIVSIVVYFVSMGFAVKVSKKIKIL